MSTAIRGGQVGLADGYYAAFPALEGRLELDNAAIPVIAYKKIALAVESQAFPWVAQTVRQAVENSLHSTALPWKSTQVTIDSYLKGRVLSSVFCHLWIK